MNQYTWLCFDVQAQASDGSWSIRPGWPICGSPAYDGDLDLSMYTADQSLIGAHLRVRARFQEDQVNLAAHSSWGYFEITTGMPTTTTQHPSLYGEI